MGAVNAADNATYDVVEVDDYSAENDIISVDDENILDSSSDEILGDSGSYDDLKNKIDNASSGSTVYLTNDYFFDGYSSGIAINKELTVDGNGYTIDANGNGRIFSISANNVVLKNIVFENANYYGNGGAVYWSGSNGSVIDCYFNNNYASNGGAVYWSGSNGSVIDCYFNNNYASYGGAVYWYVPNGDITDSSFINNHAYYDGGAVYWYGSDGGIDGSDFSDNYADGSGGAVYWSGSNGGIEDSYFYDNFAGGSGGAVYWFGSNGGIDGSDFSVNSADGSGGAVYLYSNNLITDSIFNNNFASSFGGAVYCRNGDTSLDNCEFYSNGADNNGGAVYFSGGDSSLTSSLFDSNIADYGGAVYFAGAQGILTDSDFTNNVASGSGGAVYWAGYSGELNSSTFTNNIASDSGGAVYWSGDYGFLFDCDFKMNSATNSGGALLWYSSYSDIAYCDFTSNRVLNGRGGAIFKRFGATEFLNCNFIDNAANYGGAMSIETDNDDEIINCNFNNNDADYGDAIEWDSFLCTIINTRFNGEKTNYDKYFYISSKYTPNFNVMANDINLGSTLHLEIDFLSFNESMCGNMDVTIINTFTNLIVYNSVQPLSEDIHLFISNLKTGSYLINVNYTGDNIYESVLKTRAFEVSGLQSSIDFSLHDIKWGETIVLNPVVNYGATGFIEVYVDGEYKDKFQVGTKYNLNGVGGPYSDITLIYLGNDNYKASFKTQRVYVERLDSNLSVPVNIESGNPSLIEINLNSDAEGSIIVVFNGETYRGEVIDGKFSFASYYLNSDNKSMVIMYSGDSKYNSFTTSCLVDVSLKVPELYLNARNVMYGNNIVITPYIEGATGKYDIYVDGLFKSQISSSSSYTIYNPQIGEYDVKVVYSGDDYYAECEKSVTVRVFEQYPIEIQNPSVVYGSGRYFNATFYDEYGEALVNKLVSFRVDGVDYVARTNVNGTAILNHDFKIGNYTLIIINTVVNEALSVPFKVFSSIDSKDMTSAYNTGADYVVNAWGDDGNPLVDGWIIFNVNNNNYAVRTDSHGNATLNANLLPGTYTVTITNAETSETKRNSLKIVSTVFASDSIKGYNSGNDFEVKFVNIYNQPLVNQKVIFNVNSTEYELTTNSNGIAILNEKLPVGKYIVKTVNPLTGEKSVKNLTIVERIVENNDVVCIPGIDAYYTMRIIGDDGKPVGANEIVKITINDVTSQIRTNNDGYASFKISQQNTGSYKIYAEYKEYMVNNTVHVLQKADYIRSIDVGDINYKQNASITVRFYSFDYNADVEIIVTNDKGYKIVEKYLAHETLSLTLSDLNATKYTVTVNYCDINNFKFSNLTKTFNVFKIDPDMVVSVGNANVGENAIITVNIPDATGRVSIKVGNRIVYDGLINDGTITASVDNLEMGVYPVYVTYNGNDNYNSMTKTDSLVITQDKISTSITSQDVSIMYGNSAYLVATLKDQYGNAVSGRAVSILLNGVNHALTTAADGTVRLMINGLAAKTYSATITFAGDSYYSSSQKSVKITIVKKDTIKLTLNKVKVKKSAKKIVLKATLKINGKAAVKKVIKFKFNKKTYSAKTNKKGVAKVTIKKNVLKKLKKGKKVTYQVKYGSVTVKKSVKVK